MFALHVKSNLRALWAINSKYISHDMKIYVLGVNTETMGDFTF